MPGKIFISYRRDDSRADARSIYQRLEHTFGGRQLFMDVDTIEKGRDFTRVLGDYLATSTVMLAVIGRDWLSAKDEEGQRRLDDPDDFVRLEIANALKRDIAVIPVLVDGARMPRAAELPDDLKPLAKRQASIVTHENFAPDLDGLARDLQRLLGGKPRRSAKIVAAVFTVALIAGAVAGFQLQLWPFSAVLTLRQPGLPSQESSAAEAKRKADEENEKQRAAAAKADEDRRQEASIGEAKRKADEEIERQRAAAAKADEDRKRLEAELADTKRKAEEAERQRIEAARAQAARMEMETAAAAKRKAEEDEARRQAAAAQAEENVRQYQAAEAARRANEEAERQRAVAARAEAAQREQEAARKRQEAAAEAQRKLEEERNRQPAVAGLEKPPGTSAPSGPAIPANEKAMLGLLSGIQQTLSALQNPSSISAGPAGSTSPVAIQFGSGLFIKSEAGGTSVFVVPRDPDARANSLELGFLSSTTPGLDAKAQLTMGQQISLADYGIGKCNLLLKSMTSSAADFILQC